MELNLNTNKNIHLIASYDKDSFTVKDHKYSSSFIIAPSAIINWNITDIHNLEHHLKEIIEYKPETVIIGTGAKTIMLPDAKLQELIQHQINYEMMSSNAAAKTYNILAMDNRNILAAIFI